MAVTAPVRAPDSGERAVSTPGTTAPPLGNASEEKDHSALFRTGKAWASGKAGGRRRTAILLHRPALPGAVPVRAHRPDWRRGRPRPGPGWDVGAAGLVCGLR